MRSAASSSLFVLALAQIGARPVLAAVPPELEPRFAQESSALPGVVAAARDEERAFLRRVTGRVVGARPRHTPGWARAVEGVMKLVEAEARGTVADWSADGIRVRRQPGLPTNVIVELTSPGAGVNRIVHQFNLRDLGWTPGDVLSTLKDDPGILERAVWATSVVTQAELAPGVVARDSILWVRELGVRGDPRPSVELDVTSKPAVAGPSFRYALHIFRGRQWKRSVLMRGEDEVRLRPTRGARGALTIGRPRAR